jgi:hydroxymethylglutaryl-CoA lyase
MGLKLSDAVRILEVGPRDGLQNEKQPIPTESKLRFIRGLIDAGINEIEATSFVSPKWVLQLADASELWAQLPNGPIFSALVPNLVGLERALQVGVDRIAVFTAASEAFTLKNINMTIDQSLAAFEAVVGAFRHRFPYGWVRGYVSTAFECPYSGRIRPEQVVAVVRRLVSIGVNELSIGDTIGAAVPREVKELTSALLSEFPANMLAYHFHDTHSGAIANVSQALEHGIRSFDSSAGGLGGCPYAPGASGNLATEDLVYFLERTGFHTGINLELLTRASAEILGEVGKRQEGWARTEQASSASEACPK